MTEPSTDPARPPVLLELVGTCDTRIFGIRPGERLRRQAAQALPAPEALKLVADAGAVIGDSTLKWLIEHPRHVIRSAGSKSAAVVVDTAQALDPATFDDPAALARHDLIVTSEGEVPPLFSRKLRRLQPMMIRSVREEPVRTIESALFHDVYKGITDVVTRWVWPVPAFWAVRACSRLGITANMVTLTSILLTVLTARFFAEGAFWAGILTGWVMTFLDTVDGKLARVTCTSSKVGNLLDHVPDIVHPPAWWACLAYSLTWHGNEDGRINASLVVIISTYVLGRLVELLFKQRYGFNQYLWRPFDAKLRTIIARRNTILLILTVGAATGQVEAAFHAAAAWSLVSIGVQTCRIVRATLETRRGLPITSWMT